mgnify:CR=1 FL=1
MKLEIEVTGCKDCPFLKWGKNYGNDGRDSEEVCFCEKGVFSSGEKVAPKIPPKKRRTPRQMFMHSTGWVVRPFLL